MTTTQNFKFNLIDLNAAPYIDEDHANWHILDAVLQKYIAINSVQGVWNNALAVTVGQRFVDEDSDTLWEVLVAHTTPSTGTFLEARAAQPTYWQSLTADAVAGGVWTVGTTYQPNTFLSDTGRFGVVLATHVSETSYDQGVTDGNIATLVDVADAVDELTAAEVLAKLITVDGAGSGLDADTLDGSQANDFATAAQGVLADNAATSAQGALADSAMQDLVDDVTPQLGGNLDVNTKGIAFPGATVTDVTGSDTTLVSGTAGTNGNLVQWDANGDAIDSSIAASSVSTLTAASQAQMETGTSTSVAVTPGRQHFHPAHAKAWCYVTVAAGAPSLTANHGVATIDDDGVGDFGINFDTAFSSTDYAMVGGASYGSSGSGSLIDDSRTAGALEVRTRNGADSLTDPALFSAAFFGDFS